jgi:hypothetical protein
MSNDTKQEIGAEVEKLRACLEQFTEELKRNRAEPGQASVAVLTKMAAAIMASKLPIEAGFVAISTPSGLSFLQPLTGDMHPGDVAMSCLIQAYAIIRDPADLLEMMARVTRAGAVKGELATLPADPPLH